MIALDNETIFSLIFKLLGDASYENHSGKVVYEHLIGTYDILKKNESSLHLQIAGALHNIYETDAFHMRRPINLDRQYVINEIGRDAEFIIYLFSNLIWSRFCVADVCIIDSNYAGYFRESGACVTADHFKDVVALFFANILDQWSVIPDQKKNYFRKALLLHGEFLPKSCYIAHSLL